MEFTITAIVKLISLLFAAAFAILGTLTSYKDDNGTVTKWGKIAIIGVIISGLISAVLLGIEETNKEAERETAKGEKVIALNREYEDKEGLNKRLGTLVNKAVEVSKNLGESIEAQRQLFNETQNISAGVTKNIQGQAQLLTESKSIAGTLDTSVNKQSETLEKTEKVQKEQSRILQNTHRALQPLERLKFRFEFKYPYNADFNSFREYLAALKTRVQDAYQALDTNKTDDWIYLDKSGSTRIFVSKDKKIRQAILFENSDFLPLEQVGSQKPLAISWVKPTINVRLHKEKIPNVETPESSADLQLKAYVTNEERTLKQLDSRSPDKISDGTVESTLRINFEDNSVTQYVHTNAIERIAGKDDGKIISFLDLPKSNIELFTPCDDNLPCELIEFNFFVGDKIISFKRNDFISLNSNRLIGQFK